MPRDFKSFAKENQHILNEDKTKTDEFQNLLDKYKNMSNDELMSNLFIEASKLKKEGKLDSSTLSNLKSTINPFLNSEQQSMLDNIINVIE